jgi:ferrochelatase
MSATATAEAPVGLLLFNLGGPGTLDDVEPFLINLFSDRDIIELPLGALLQPIVARIITRSRLQAVKENYRSIGGGSPQLALTRAQGEALARRLKAAGHDVRTFIAMRYWRPSTQDALEAMRDAGIRRIVTVTMYPHYSCATTGSSERELQRHLERPEWRGRFEIDSVSSYYDDPLYLDAMTDTVRRALEAFPADVRDRVVLLFSAHGLPQKFIDRGDPYIEHIEATRRGILERLRVPNRQVLGYQSRTGPVKWISPGTDEKIAELGREGVRELLLVPLSFVSDHIETLYEVDQLFAEDARRAGITDYRRPEALNTHPLFIESLARQVERCLSAPSPRTSRS